MRLHVVANLTIKRKWLDKIVALEKREEYRAPATRGAWIWPTRYVYARRDGEIPVVVLRAGYTMQSRAAVVRIWGVQAPPNERGVFALEAIREPKHPEWGEPPLPHWTLRLGDVLEVGDYAKCKAYLNGVAK